MKESEKGEKRTRVARKRDIRKKKKRERGVVAEPLRSDYESV